MCLSLWGIEIDANWSLLLPPAGQSAQFESCFSWDEDELQEDRLHVQARIDSI